MNGEKFPRETPAAIKRSFSVAWSMTMLALLAPSSTLAAPPYGALEIEVGSSPSYSAIADIDGDGDLDAVVSLSGADAVRVLENDGGGGLSPSGAIRLAGEPRQVAFGDVDGDGSVDLLVAEFHSRVVEIFLNDGGGTFSASPSTLALSGSGRFVEEHRFPTDEEPFSIAVGDVDDDGAADLVVPCRFFDDVNVLFRTPRPAFGGIEELPGRTGGFDVPQGVALADIDADGDLDVAVAERGAGLVSLWKNDGEGVFGAAGGFTPFLGVGSRIQWVFFADMDGDRDLDAVLPAPRFGWFTVFSNGGTGVFTPGEPIPSGAAAVDGGAVRDFDGDGDHDVALLGNDFLDPSRLTIQRFERGAPTEQIVHRGLPVQPEGLAAGDVDGDGDIDLVTVHAGGEILLWGNDGAAGFTSTTLTTVALFTDVAAADLDGDGADEIVALDAQSERAIVYSETSGVLFETDAVPVGAEPFALAIADVTADRRLDVLASNQAGEEMSISLAARDSGRSFATTLTFLAGLEPWAMAAGDVDGDLDVDLVLPNVAEESVWLMFNRNATPVDVDLDLDGLSDFTEILIGTDPADFDTDDDGLADSVDPSIVIDAIERLPPGAFLPRVPVRRQLIDRILLAESHELAGRALPAINVLESAAARTDGCIGDTSTPADDDWVIDCAAQLEIRLPINLLLETLTTRALDPQEPF